MHVFVGVPDPDPSATVPTSFSMFSAHPLQQFVINELNVLNGWGWVWTSEVPIQNLMMVILYRFRDLVSEGFLSKFACENTISFLCPFYTLL